MAERLELNLCRLAQPVIGSRGKTRHTVHGAEQASLAQEVKEKDKLRDLLFTARLWMGGLKRGSADEVR